LVDLYKIYILHLEKQQTYANKIAGFEPDFVDFGTNNTPDIAIWACGQCLGLGVSITGLATLKNKRDR
jgi:hypothetical protein